jgi:glycosyltransferase involved in cell wall biosynthesis
VPTAVHAVFRFEKHGFTYATINKAMLGSTSAPAEKWKSDLVVPHIVRPPDPTVVETAKSLRSALNISKQALVVCRSGGKYTFNIDFAKDAVKQLTQRFSAEQLQFLFLNTDDSFVRRDYRQQYSNHIHFMKATIDDHQKESFFSTCDAFLHARKDGETFGLAVAEFSIRNKPVITYGGIKDAVNRHHLDVLKDAAFIYNDSTSLQGIIASFVQNGIPRDNKYDAFKEFRPEQVFDDCRHHRFCRSPLICLFWTTILMHSLRGRVYFLGYGKVCIGIFKAYLRPY